jgi:hypothetical protein
MPLLHLATRAALPGVLLICLALTPAAAHAAPASSWSYDVTVNAEMSYKWDFKEEAHLGHPSEPCDRFEVADGTAKVQLHSRRPTRVGIFRTTGGRPPGISAGSRGVPLVGSDTRTGRDEERHEGPKCGPANPPRIMPTSGCGQRNVKTYWNLAWTAEPRTLSPIMSTGNLRENCPAGPPSGLQWKDGVQPTIAATTAHASPSKFYGTRQFTIRGSRTFQGVVSPISQPHFSRSGQAEMTWQWQTTYRLVKKPRKRRR